MGDLQLPSFGRIVNHDVRSWEFPARRAAQIRSVSFLRRSPVLDQGDLGSCTGNAAAGVLMTDPFFARSYTLRKRMLNEDDAVALYSAATRFDGIRGVYPPDDTGSSGLGVAKAAKAAGYISGYRHAFGLQHALEALSLKPCIVGINWYDSFFKPNRHNGQCEISPGAAVAGGHEIELIGIDLTGRTVEFVNSWGTEWGRAGRARFSFDTFGQLLHEDGDVTVFDG